MLRAFACIASKLSPATRAATSEGASREATRRADDFIKPTRRDERRTRERRDTDRDLEILVEFNVYLKLVLW